MYERISVLVALVVLALGSSCERPKAPVNGIGGFQLAKTTLERVRNQAVGHCFESQGRTSCMIVARQSIAKRTPQIQLEFAGSQPSSLLRRILLDIPGCNVDDIRSWFEARLGQADHRSDKGGLWQQKHIVLSLLLSGPSRCQVIAVDPVDEPHVEAVVRAHHGDESASPGD